MHDDIKPRVVPVERGNDSKIMNSGKDAWNGEKYPDYGLRHKTIVAPQDRKNTS